MKIFSRVETGLLCVWMVLLLFTLQQAGAYLTVLFLLKDTSLAVITNGSMDGILTSFAMVFTLIAKIIIVTSVVKWKIKQASNNKQPSKQPFKPSAKPLSNNQHSFNKTSAEIQPTYTVMSYLAIRLFNWRVAIGVIGIWLLFLIGSEALSFVLDRNPTEFMDTLYNTANPKWLLIVAVVVIVPIYEELVFRGLLWSALSHQIAGKRGIWLASVVTSILFAVIHIQYEIYEMSVIFVLALILSLARHKSGSLLLPIGIHSVNNGIAMWQYLSS